jgi:hypothetical protein
MILIGFAVLLYGTRFIQYTFVLLLGLIFLQIGLRVYESWHIEDTNPDYMWIFLGLGFCTGVGVAYFALSVITLVKLSIGGYFGYTVSTIAYQFILRYIETTKPEIVYWITVFVCIAIGCILVTFLVKQVMIVATSMIGSYSIVKGISLYAGKFPNEQIIFELLKNQEFEQLAEVNYCYLYLNLFILFVLNFSIILI